MIIPSYSISLRRCLSGIHSYELLRPVDVLFSSSAVWGRYPSRPYPHGGRSAHFRTPPPRCLHQKLVLNSAPGGQDSSISAYGPSTVREERPAHPAHVVSALRRIQGSTSRPPEPHIHTPKDRSISRRYIRSWSVVRRWQLRSGSTFLRLLHSSLLSHRND